MASCVLGNKLLNIQFAKYHIWNNKSEGFPNMVLSPETFNQSVRTEYAEALNARYTFQPLFALVTRRPYCPGRPKKLCFTMPSLTVETMGVRLGPVFGLPGQYGRRVTKANGFLVILIGCIRDMSDIEVGEKDKGTLCDAY